MGKRQQFNLLAVVETEIAIKINPNIAYSTLMKDFSECIFPVESYDEVFKFIAERIALGDCNFIEGIGRIEDDRGQDFTEDLVVIYSASAIVSSDIVGTEYV